MFVDIHNYILPVNEGPGNDEGAIRLAKQAVANGITHIIAAPRSMNKANKDFEIWIKHLVTNLNKKFIDQNIPLTILEGMEIQLQEDLIDDFEEKILPLAGTNKYVLIEFPKNRIPAFYQKVLYAIQLKVYIPIIAHPELNLEVRKNPSMLLELVNKGALVQVNAASLLGKHGRGIKRFAKKICRHNLVHFVTTNAYSNEKQPFIQQSAYKVIQKRFSKEFVHYLQKNAVHIIEGTGFHIRKPIKF